MAARDMPGRWGRFLQAVLSSHFEGARGYILAAAAVAIAFLIRLGMQDFLQDRAIFTLFIPSILVASITGGIGRGLAAVGFSLLAALYLGGCNSTTRKMRLNLEFCFRRTGDCVDGRNAPPRKTCH